MRLAYVKPWHEMNPQFEFKFTNAGSGGGAICIAHRAATGVGASPSNRLPSRTRPRHSNTVGDRLVAALLPFSPPFVPALPPLPPLPPLRLPVLPLVSPPLLAVPFVMPFTAAVVPCCAAAFAAERVLGGGLEADALLGDPAGDSVPSTSSPVATSSAFAIVQKLGSLQVWWSDHQAKSVFQAVHAAIRAVEHSQAAPSLVYTSIQHQASCIVHRW